MGQVIKFAAQQRKTRSAVALPKHPTVLIADDNDRLREILVQHLHHQGYRVRTAGDGKAALSILAKEEVHVLLLDLQLPELDGFTVLRHVRDERRGPFPHVIAMSRLSSGDQQEKAFALAADDFLAKPFFLTHLSARLRIFMCRYWPGNVPDQSA